MESKQFKKIYHAAIYVRLSKEDGDVAGASKAESNSISNQKELIRNFLKDKEDIVVVSERVDDGYSGSSFERPSFKLMLEDIKKGVVDCVVVKDLSRFGREYIDSGRYIERLFPALGVRFIAINDGYDSLEGKDQSDEIIIPFKNLIKNMSYSGREFRYFTLFRQICVQQSHFVSFLQGIMCLSVGYVSICCVLSKKGNSPYWCRA